MIHFLMDNAAFKKDELSSEIKYAEHSKILPNGITITSKGGEGLGCPPNSEISAIYAFNNGYDGYRINICKTKDGILVCSHDASINSIARNKDGTEIKEAIIISEHTLREINAYDFGIKYGEEYSGLTITTFKDMVAKTAKLGLKLDIEWKYPDPKKEDFEYIYNVISKNGYSNKNWHWIGYNKMYLDWFKEICDYVDEEVLIHPSSID
ncbi:glycerophosphodiester phosphodiesterase [Oribacterium sp. KHPX15]|uniref:glycerophosphodiester phosphodiesterase n=1 Tax=Oribacterium sp. KHPX15 TaxID=1855342 RepID=UPI0015878E16|nr:glycerophosphodiester phosphodiesterase family protein [Oribacterium sp. KHPX15]